MAVVIVTTTILNETKFLIGKESRFLRDIYPDVRMLETCKLPKDYMGYYKTKCKQLSRKYGMRIQFDTPDIYATYTRSRFRYLGKWKYGIVKGNFNDEKDLSSLDTAIREFNEEVMSFDKRDAFQDMNMKIHSREIYSLHIENSNELCSGIASRVSAYYGELYDIELQTWEELQSKWCCLNMLSKRALELVKI